MEPKEIEAEVEDKYEGSSLIEPENLNEDLNKIAYFEQINKLSDHRMNENLVLLHQMGFCDFSKNLQLLEQNNNDISVALMKLLE